MKKIAFFIVFVAMIMTSYVYPNEYIDILGNMYHIDFSKRLIIINQDIATIQSVPNPHAIKLGDEYLLNFNYDSIKIGQAYKTLLNGDTYLLYFTELPIIEISTQNEINDTAKVFANVTISEKNGDVMTSGVGIKYRGGSSIWAAKKSYRVEFWADAVGAITKDVRLFGMRSDDDWNFNSMQNEPLRVRSVSGNELWNNIYNVYYKSEEPSAKCGIENKYAEIFVNGIYMGIFAVGERVDRKQLKLVKFDGRTRGELYKGITWEGGATIYTACPPAINGEKYWAGFEYDYPKEIEPNWDNLRDFIDFVVNSPDKEFYTNYKKRFNFENLIDYFLFLNVTFAADNTGKNIWVARYDRNEPYFYVPWDLDGTMGLRWDGQYYENTDWILSNGLYDRAICDCSTEGFFYKAKARWEQLRENILTLENVADIYQQNYSNLLKNGAYEREEIAWADYHYPATDISLVPSWLSARLQYLDDFFANGCTDPKWNNALIDGYFNIYPNPSTNHFTIELGSSMTPAFIEIYNSYGEVVGKQEFFEGELIVNTTPLPSGIYFVKVTSSKTSAIRKVIVVK